MKKLSLLIGGLFFSGLMIAQTTINSDGPLTLEGQTTIGGVVGTHRLAPAARVRYFFNDNLAIRGTFGYIGRSTTENFFENEIDNTGAEGKYTSKNNVWNAALGFEYHVLGTEKVSPYIAADFVYGAGKTIVDGQNASSSSYMMNYSLDTERPWMRIGGALMGGLDYNFSTAFYLGGEVGVQITSTTNGEGKTEINNNGFVTNSKSNISKSGFTGDLIGTLRLGFRF